MKTILNLIDAHLFAALTLAYISGIICSAHYHLPITHTGVIIFAISCAIFQISSRLQKTSTSTLILSFFLFFLAGIIHGNISSRTPQSPNHIFNLIDKPTDAVIVGHLAKMPAFDSFSSQALIETQSITIAPSKSFTPAHGRILLKLSTPWPDNYPPGTLLAIRATLQRPTRFLVPGTFDYPAYLARKDIWITGFSRSPAQLHSVSTSSNTGQFVVEQLRNTIGNFIDQHTSSSQIAAIYRAILLGDRSRIPGETIDKFKASGTMHILAISGLHMTLIGSLLFCCTYWFLRRSSWLMLNCNAKKLSGAICLPLIAGYTLLAGGNAPVLRAGIMSSILILAFCIDRPKTVSSLIALGAIVILTLSPQSLYTVSFQLSFAAFCSIMLVIPLLRQLLTDTSLAHTAKREKLAMRAIKWITASLVVSVVASLGTAPLTLFFFNRLPLTGPVANLFLEPLICLWALPLGFLALPCIFFLPPVATFLLQLGSPGLQLAIDLSGIFSNIPHTTLWLPKTNILLIILYYCTFIFTLSKITTRIVVREKLLISLPFAICLTLLLTPLESYWPNQSETASIYILDVGQGSATLLQLSDGKNILIDGGGSTYSKESVGQRVIAPFLWSKGITTIDSIIVTHPDADHYNGIPFLVEHFDPSQIWTNTLHDGNQDFQETLSLAKRKGIDVIQAKTGDIIHNSNVIVKCIANTSIDNKKTNTRNTGLVIEVKNNHSRALFPGDIDSHTEKQLVEIYPDLSADILLAAHHGSSSSNSPIFLNHIKPKTIIASAGKTRSHLFPSKKLRNYCEQQQLPLLATSETGTVKIELRGNTTEVLLFDRGSGNPLSREQHKWLPAQSL